MKTRRYLVFDDMSRNPRVLPPKNPDLAGPGFAMRALDFLVMPTPHPQP
jgi:hypothetical protein